MKRHSKFILVFSIVFGLSWAGTVALAGYAVWQGTANRKAICQTSNDHNMILRGILTKSRELTLSNPLRTDDEKQKIVNVYDLLIHQIPEPIDCG